MNRVILQPTGNRDAREHYDDTILNPVSLKVIEKYLSDKEFKEIENIYPNGEALVWGVTRGKNNVNFNKWDKIQTGDISFFARNKEIFSSAIVTMKLHNRNLARDLWGEDNEGRTWECVYFLDELKKQSISYETFNRVVGYASKNVIQGFSVLDEEKSEKILSYFDLGSDEYFSEITEQEFEKATLSFNVDSLDREAKTKIRVEQGFLRDKLFRNKKTDTCGICGRLFPIEFLVAAHIKKRSLCNDDEKLDYKNIVMPMCKFGCDDLYEKGYITVISGNVIINKKFKVTEEMKKYLADIENRLCMYWNNSTQRYFEWHQQHHYIEMVSEVIDK